MQNKEIIQIIENLKGRKNYEEKKSKKLGFNSLYEYIEDKLAKKAETEKIAKQIVTIPIHPNLTQSQIDYIVKTANRFS